MRSLQKLFANKDIIIYFSVICVFVIFKEPILEFISLYWVNPVASKTIASNLKNIAFFFVVLGIIAYFLSKEWRHYLPNKKVIVWSLLCSIIYSSFRFNNKSIWEFTTLKGIEWLKYADIFLLTGIISFLLLVKLVLDHFKEKPLTSSLLFNDAPLMAQEGAKSIMDQDGYGFYSYAQNIANGINNSQFETAFAIGVTSKWGGGKTSFFNMIKDSLNINLIEIDFNPWRSANPKAIIRDFFETVRKALAPYSSQIEMQLLNYCEKIIELNDSALNKSAKLLLSSLSSEHSLNELFGQINSSLKLLDKKLVIFIDDVDRLDKEEVFEVIRLIRNTANFHNAFFVVAYDRAYILHSLKSLEIHQYEIFLEKIFQLEITLPYYDKSVLVKRLISNLCKILPEKRLDQVSTIILGNIALKKVLFQWLVTFRDVTLLSNSIFLNISCKIDDVDLIDFIRMELLKIKFLSVYKAFFEHYEDFLETIEPVSQLLNSGTYKLKYNQEKSSYCLEEYLTNNKDKLSIPEYSINSIMDFFLHIFPENSSFSFTSQNREYLQLSIINVEQFHLYYSFELPSWYFPRSEFLKVIKLSNSEIKKKFTSWVDEMKEDKLLNKIYHLKVDDINNRQEFENLIYSIFYLANLKSIIFKNSFYTTRVKFDFKWLYEAILPEGKFIKKFYSSDKTVYKSFIDSIFSNKESEQIYEAEFLKEAWIFANDTFKNELKPIMNSKEVAHYLVAYLKSCCEKETELTNNIWHFYDCCKIPYLVERNYVQEVHRDSRIPEANSIFIDFITNQDLNTFLLYNIHISPSDTTRFQIGNMGNEVFGSLIKFEEFLVRQDEARWKYLNEYRKFHQKSRASEGKWISFDFEVIDIQKQIKKIL